MPSLFEYTRDSNIHIFKSTRVPAMEILTRSGSQTFVQMALDKSKSCDVVINGTFNSYNSMSALFGTLPPQDVRPTGPVIQNGKAISSMAGEGKYYMAYSETPFRGNTVSREYKCGIGPLPTNTLSGLGGLGGLIFRGMAADAQNEYSKEVPDGAPPTGEPPEKYAPFIRKRSNAMYKAVENRGSGVGKVAIAFTASAQIIIGVQGDGDSGISLDEFRDRIVRLGAINGVLLDCSDSACLVYKGNILVHPASHKNNSSVIGVGFKD